jgi:hypothetical protein
VLKQEAGEGATAGALPGALVCDYGRMRASYIAW